MNEWKTVRLGDLIHIKHGYPFKSDLFSEELTGKPIVVNIGNFNYTGGFRFDETTLKEYRGEYPKEYELDAGDILLVMTCQTAGGEILGIPATVPNSNHTYLHNQRLGKVIVLNNALVDLKFLYWLFLSPSFNRELVTTASGTKILHTSPSRIENYKFQLPPLYEQKRIAEILGALDDKIELNRRMNRTLEGMARALFQSWFVDFDPVHAKARGETPYGMDEATAALFPDSFEETALGRVPMGWKMSTIGEEFNLLMGQSPPGETYNEIGDGLPFYQGRRDFGIRFPSIRVFCNAPSRIAQKGDSLVSVRAPVGDVNMALEECCIGRGVAAIRHKSMAQSFTYYSMLATEAIFKNFEGEGTVFGSISGKDFRNIPFVKPCNMVIAAFEKLAYPMDEQIRVNEIESRTLAALRDTLLPKLVSGEIRQETAAELI